MILDPELKKKELTLSGYRTDSADYRFKILADARVSPYYDPDYGRHCSVARTEKDDSPTAKTANSTFSTHGDNNSVESSHPSKSQWLRSLKKKHLRKRNKATQPSATEFAAPRFTAISIPTSPPRLRNRIILSQDKISLHESTGRTGCESSPFKITLETTLLEGRPYTICSTVLQRYTFQTENQDLEGALSHFEVVDTKTGYVLSQKPLPSLSQGSETDSKRIPASKSKKFRSKKPKHAREVPPNISRTICTELQPHRPSHLTLVFYPIPSTKSGTERLFDGLRIPNPKLLVGRSLKIRLRPSVALWSAKPMREVFGFGEEIKAWPDAYERPLVLKCLDGGEEEAEKKGDYTGDADFEIVD